MIVEIKWSNVVALALGIVALVILWKAGPAVVLFLGSMRDIGPGPLKDQAMGLVAFGLICIVIVAIVKILADGR
jgi:hypothetical protein